MIAKVALSIPFSYPFDYTVPSNLVHLVRPGIRALVPLGPRKMIGVVVEMLQQSEFERLKTILDLVEEKPIFDRRMLDFTRWISDYYLCSWGEVLDAAIPRGLKPRIEKRIDIREPHDFFARLDQEQKEWLLSIAGKKETVILKTQGYRDHKTLYNQCRKKGLISFQYDFSGCYQIDESEEWLSIQPGEAGKNRPRKGSKALRVLELLEKMGRIKGRDLRERISGVKPVVNRLIEKGVVNREMVKAPATPSMSEIRTERFISLNDEQDIVVREILTSIEKREYKTFLLHGVTGSGKTEVYLYAVRETVLQGRTALILVPEISLTPQSVSRFKDRFGESIAVLHSGLADKDRRREWWKIKDRKCNIVIGARSAIFAPLDDIGLIVVDEEHDSSYKQQETPFYNARDAAVKLASEQGAVVILGSATPSMESRYNAETDKYTLLTLRQRANRRPLPSAEIVNLKEEKRQSGVFYLSEYLVSKLKENYASEKQALIFLNRRGYAAFLSCKSCEMPLLCSNCSIAMTWHKSQQSLICHHCGFRQSYPKSCPTCRGDSFRLEGIGTQRVERDLSILFPGAEFLRMDRDTVRKRGSLEANIERINRRKVDFIIGTQLISKGHDFKHIGIVCIVLADMSLNIPDFRSSERSFQLISQVSGRAGRDEKGEGLTLIQSYNPNHFAIASANNHDFPGFFTKEIELRRILDNPPFARLILFRISDRNPKYAETTSRQLGTILKHRAAEYRFQVLGPVESPIQKINNRYYWQILLKSKSTSGLKDAVRRLFWEGGDWKPKSTVRISIDVDPYMMM
ncbi:MAG: primosomal protein N' [Proteobacteria bacterium]|nr:primosomal protein N' [Pseudomonadota bacterium]